MKQHVQVYTDDRQGWTMPSTMPYRKGLLTMYWSRKLPGGHECRAAVQYSTAAAGRAAGRAVLRQAGLARGDSPARLLHRGANIRSRMWHCRRLTVRQVRRYLAEPTDHG